MTKMDVASEKLFFNHKVLLVIDQTIRNTAPNSGNTSEDLAARVAHTYETTQNCVVGRMAI